MMVVLIPKKRSVLLNLLKFQDNLVQQNKVAAPENFIKSIPHLSFVWGEKMSITLKHVLKFYRQIHF
jgi:hypothetical protein